MPNIMLGILPSRFFYPPTQKTTGLPVDECENSNPFASADVRPYLEKADRYSAKLPNENFGAKQNDLEGTTALAVGLHFISFEKIR